MEKALPLGVERPQLEKNTSFLSIFIFILLATVIALLLLKFALFTLWRFWFFLSVFFTLTISFAAFVPETVAIVSAIVLIITPKQFSHLKYNGVEVIPWCISTETKKLRKR